MKRRKENGLDFEVDKLTNSIENAISGESQVTEVRIMTKSDLPSVKRKNGWLFDWKSEFISPEKDVFKLVTQSAPGVIQGLISITRYRDHVFMHLLESAKFNRGQDKLYLGVPANLVAYACRLSFHQGSEGIVAFRSKTKLIEHYEKTLRAKHHGGHLMVIPTEAALILTDKYFPDTAL